MFLLVLVSRYGSHTEAGVCTLPSSVRAAAAAAGCSFSMLSMLIWSGFFSPSPFWSLLPSELLWWITAERPTNTYQQVHAVTLHQALTARDKTHPPPLMTS